MEEALNAGKGEQDYAVTTTRFIGEGGRVTALEVAEAESFAPKPGTERELPAGLVLLAMGFLGPELALLEQLEVARDQRGNAKAPTYETSAEGIFAAGDARRGQSLIVWAINEGRQAARICDRYLGGLRDELATGNTEPADDGPEGPPLHVSGGVSVARADG
jgi:glutamate synthase (NADPH/NADH) small chain